MPPKRAINGNTRAGVRANNAIEVADEGGGRGKRQKVRTQRAIESDSLPAGTASQPIQLPETQPTAPSPPSSPSQAPSQPATPAEDPLSGQVIGGSQRPWELQLLELQALTPLLASKAATEASTVAEDNNGGGFDERFADNYDGINWDKLARYQVPRRTLTGKKSWVFQYGYRVALKQAPAQLEANEPERTFFVCRWCHQNTPASSVIEVTDATSSVAKHLGRQRRGHRLTARGKQLPQLPGGQSTILDALKKGVVVPQAVANELGNFDVQGFRLAAVQWLVENNHPLREFETESFRRMLQFANPAAVDALWTSHNSVSRFVLRLYDYLVPIVKAELATAISKVHISFDGWTAKGGKRGFFGIVAHYVDTSGKIRDLPLALPQLAGVHSGEKIGECVDKALQAFGITEEKLGYFVLDNAASNDVAVEYLGKQYRFTAAQRRLRCSCHTINLVGQTVMFGKDKDAYDNDPKHEKDEEKFMAEWRRLGPLGVFLDITNYISTPKQYHSFSTFQHLALAEDPTNKALLLAVVKAVVTRWNSYCAAFERGLILQRPITDYAKHHISRIKELNRTANKPAAAPAWMRSTGLTAADWAVITEYVDILKPLKVATERLEGRGKSRLSGDRKLNGRFGALYEVIPTLEQLISTYEERLVTYRDVDFEQEDAPEDHLAINLRAAVAKLKLYYSKLSDCPAYYAAIVLHPRYRNYCKVAWSSEPAQLAAADAAFQQLWCLYRRTSTPRLPPRPVVRRSNAIDDAVDAIIEAESDSDSETGDEYERWRACEPRWSRADFDREGNPVRYWLSLRNKYPSLAQFALDILSIPASSAECERLFSELGDLLEPKRRKIGSQLLAALQCVRSWLKAGFMSSDDEVDETNLTDAAIDSVYGVSQWDD